jgi:hypothetical protein
VKAAYAFRFSCPDDVLKTKAEEIKGKIGSGEELFVTRTGGKRKMPKQIDVLPYIDSVDYEGPELCVWCNITGGGTVRLEELVEVLQIDEPKLIAPITRKQVLWKIN